MTTSRMSNFLFIFAMLIILMDRFQLSRDARVSLNKLIRYFMWSVFKRRSDLYVDAELLPKLADSAIRIVGKRILLGRHDRLA